MSKISLWSLLPEELDAQLIQAGYKKFRSQQILLWLYKQNARSFTAMTNLDKKSRDELDNLYSLYLPEVAEEQVSQDGTRKFLLQLQDANYIEMVLIPGIEKLTLCISSQVGCSRGCQFCATSRLGLTRNLNTDEIIGQIIKAGQLTAPQKITNIVFMGMGEPLDNLDTVIKSINILQHERTLAFSPRRVTVSTCGIVPGILKLADTGVKMKLAVSLNAALDEKREILMPVNQRYPLAQLKPALLYFSRRSPHRITFEYVLIKNFNMAKEDMKALRAFTGDISSKINIIPWNPVPGSSWQAPSAEEVAAFQQELYKTSNVAVTLRNSRGQDISAACGMLAGKKKKEEQKI
ncbi:MAG: 23S rRNA (adenine(2503)-C(2))-methyltransferase RlmN [Candidatus Cloacimonetes bacterium]|nr:23S rRNA (adenine(2503)-C(2))-methyltransferase RlmN [Candidatus Cloacimonadota bacterium]